ncbi:hypothetical protein JMJ77_0001434 [Colletotrichum scovillei]|uniref:Uncharacterized protein n=1 Tax=Colletotrichum scovillei TaxID=1209932 RepID=A0A9P7UIA7_9PEZI|nr:hypothetical protein JMJ77_0001434 [Colletotrichum scovillei]KAG7072658.1 hypothetical protein JMJ76_0005505 [Colletotrichum scovillei]KAG7080903.1 hypothetical protein JMJ78_0007986 [Colletotrichum scovillei]
MSSVISGVKKPCPLPLPRSLAPLTKRKAFPALVCLGGLPLPHSHIPPNFPTPNDASPSSLHNFGGIQWIDLSMGPFQELQTKIPRGVWLNRV